MKRKSLVRLLAEAGVRLVRRHKVLSSVVAVFAAAVIVVSLVTTGGGTSEPVAANFTLSALGQSGQRVSLSQYAGQPVIVNFWASWCEPCQQETPLLARWYKQQDGHVVLLGLDENDNASTALKYARERGVSYPLGFDPVAIVASAYHVGALPQTFFLDARHRIVDHVGGAVTQAELAQGLRMMKSG